MLRDMKGRILLLTMLMTLAISMMGQTKYEKYIDAANQGDAEAQYQIGICYKEGTGVRKNMKMSAQWFTKSAEQGHAKAQFQIGLAYNFKIFGVKPDPQKALYWMTKSAEQGCVEAQETLGLNFYSDFGMSPNSSKAFYWLTKAAEQGSTNVLHNLGFFYFNGKGVKQDYEQAAYWFKKAVENAENDVMRNQSQKAYKEAQSKLRQQNTSNTLAQQQQAQTPVQQQVPVPIQQQVPDPVKKPLSPVDKDIPTTDQNDRNTFAIVIGNEKYKNVAEVPFAENDAKVFSEYVQKTLGVPGEQVKLIENATYNDIRMALSWLEKAMTLCSGKGKIIVFYAGHGIPNESDNSAYLLPVDGIGNDPTSAYSLMDFYQKLGSMQAQSITVFLDACFSGSKRDNGMLIAARGVAIKAKQSAPKGKMVVFSAAQGDETAYPYQDMQHGMFTYFLLKKLQETKGAVTLGELGDYLQNEVKRQSFLKNNKMQTPMVSVATSLQNSWKNLKLK